MSVKLDERGRELTQRLADFAKDFEQNEAITEDEKETAYKTLQGEFEEWHSARSRSEGASEMMAKLATGGNIKDAKTGESVTKFEVSHPFTQASRRAIAAQVLEAKDKFGDSVAAQLFAANEHSGTGRKKIDLGLEGLGLKDATEAGNVIGEGLDGFNSVSASGVGQNPFLAGTFGPGILPDFRPGIVEQLFYQLTINDLISSFATTSPNISYLTESSVNLQANQVAEAGTFPFSSIELARVYAQVGKIANALTISDEAVADAPTLFNFVQGRLLMSLQRQEEVQILAASGYPGVSGLLSFASSFAASSSGSIYGATSGTGSSIAFPPAGTNGAGVASQTISSLHYGRVVTGAGTSYPDPLSVSLNLKDAAVDIELAVFQSPTAHIMHPRDWQRLETAQDANQQFMNTSMFGNVYGVSRGPVKSLWGVPVCTTPLMPVGTILTGWFDPQTVQIARRQGVQMQMTNSNESDFIEGKITVRADERLGLLCYRPTAFELTHLVAG
jgi:HK97 family phage major capsid protein